MLDAPFFGVLASRLLIVEDTTCETMWTDSVSIGYNPEYVDSISDHELKGVWVHEVLHVAGGHCWRIGMRNPEDWNEAADYAINPIVVAGGYVLPQGVLLDARYDGLPAEMVYELLKKDRPPKPQPSKGQPQDGKGQQQPGDSGAGDAGDPGDDKSDEGSGDASAPDDAAGGKPSKKGSKGTGKSKQGDGQGGESGTDEVKAPKRAGEVRKAPEGVDVKTLQEEWKTAVNNAAVFAASQGDLPGYLKDFVDSVKQPTVDWKEALWQFVQQSFYSPDYRWTRPNRNYMPSGLYLPSLVGEEMPEMVVAEDTSFSVFPALTRQFRSELSAIMEQMKPRKIYHLQADTRITKIAELEPGDAFDFEVAGRGGTDFRPVFKWVNTEGHEPCCLLYMSDLDGPFPEREPDYPVLWVCPPGSPSPPWGVKLEMSFDEYN